MASRVAALFLLAPLVAACTVVSVPEPREDVAIHPAPAPHPGVYLSVRTDGPAVDFASLLAHYDDFADVSTEANFYPVGIRITQQTRNMNNVLIAVVEACVCGGTLALIPCVNLTEQDTTFQLLAGADVVYEFTHTVPYRAVTWWFAVRTRENTASAAAQRSAADAVAAFVDQLRADPKVQSMLREYDASRAIR